MIINKIKTFSLVQLLCLLLLSSLSYSQGYGVKTIVIDAGHGGHDGGASNGKYKEKDIVLNVALLTGKYIEQYLDDVKVIYTRKDDTFIGLNERADIANKAKADLFISIHANAAGNKSAYGTETFVLGTKNAEANLKIAQRENSVITFEDNFEEKYNKFDPSSPDSYIIFNFIQNAHLEQSTTLATLIQNQYTNRVGRKDREVKQAGFIVLSKTSMPSILTELGFISNEKEKQFLVSKEGQDFMASAIFRAVRDYKKDVESKQSLTMSAEESSAQNINDEEVTTVENSEEKGIVYKLQIFSSSTLRDKNDPAIKGIEDVSYYMDNNLYKYTVGHTSDFKTAKQLKKKFNKQFKGCFIIAFRDGKRISIDEAKKG